MSQNTHAHTPPKPAENTESRPKILIRSSWQSINIGDIGHTPGLLNLLEKYLPEAELILWAGDLSLGVEQMLRGQFPQVTIINGHGTPDGYPAGEEGMRLWHEADYFIHGSGPSLVAQNATRSWAASGRPYGIYAITLDGFDDECLQLLKGADFVFCRDTDSLRAVRARKAYPHYMEFAPDAAFAADECDHTAADAFLKKHDLRERQFLCVLSRLRYTPYFKIRNRAATPLEQERMVISEAHKEADHEPLRHAMIDWVRTTGMKILVCPEMTYEIELTKEQLVDRMPADVKPFIVWRDTYWCPDEAAGVYAKAIAMLSMEMHSPILAAAVNTPALYLRLPTDTCKGQMWRDIGLPEWIYEVGECEGPELAAMLTQMISEPARTEEKLTHARQRVAHLQQHSMQLVRQCVLQRSRQAATAS